MSNQVEIIQLSPDEWQQYKQLRLRALREEPMAFGTVYEEAVAKDDESWKSRLINGQAGQKSILLFAKQGGELVGMLTSELLPEQKMANLHAVYVTSEARGMGVASLLMSEMLRLLKSKNIEKAHLDVNEAQAAAIGLYEKFDFKIVDEIDKKLGDGKQHKVLVMFREL